MDWYARGSSLVFQPPLGVIMVLAFVPILYVSYDSVQGALLVCKNAWASSLAGFVFVQIRLPFAAFEVHLDFHVWQRSRTPRFDWLALGRAR